MITLKEKSRIEHLAEKYRQGIITKEELAELERLLAKEQGRAVNPQ